MRSCKWLALLAMILVAPLGCMSKSESAAPGVYGGYYQDGLVATESTASTGMIGGAEAPYRDFADAKTAPEARDEAPAPAQAPAPVAPEGGKAPPSASATNEPDDDQPDHGRHMVYTASLQLAVYELDQVMEFAEDIPVRYGGWVQARFDYQITLRVPAARLTEVMNELSTLGVVLGKTLQASDVTAQYTDLESRIAVLEKMVTQLELLLKDAKTVEDSLKVRQELERVRIELEAARTQFRQLAELVGFSTLTLHLSLRGTDGVLPSSNDPFPWVDQLGVESTEFR